jgi:hypothetical protein
LNDGQRRRTSTQKAASSCDRALIVYTRSFSSIVNSPGPSTAATQTDRERSLAEDGAQAVAGAHSLPDASSGRSVMLPTCGRLSAASSFWPCFCGMPGVKTRRVAGRGGEAHLVVREEAPVRFEPPLLPLAIARLLEQVACGTSHSRLLPTPPVSAVSRPLRTSDLLYKSPADARRVPSSTLVLCKGPPLDQQRANLCGSWP